MSQIIKPVFLDETGKRIAVAMESIAQQGTQMYADHSARISTLESEVDTLNAGGLNLKDEIIESSVQDWLDAHPEATTTVQDHSLTIDKMVVGTLGYVTPEMFGAVGDGVTDDTQALKATVESGALVIKLKPNAVYLVSVSKDKDTVLKIINDNTILRGNNATIKLATNEYKDYRIIDIYSANMLIENLNIVGDAETHDYNTVQSTHEWGFGITIHGNGIISNCKVGHCTGDGIHTCNNSLRQYEQIIGKNGCIKIIGCEVYKCRRNGITVADSDIVKLIGCHIHDIGDFGNIVGASPKSGIDCEASYVATNELYMENCIIENNTSYGLLCGWIESTASSDNKLESLLYGKINNCIIYDINTRKMIEVYNSIIGCQKRGPVITKIYNSTINIVPDKTLVLYECVNCKIVGIGDGQFCVIKNEQNNGVKDCMFENIALYSIPQWRNQNFINCTFVDCYDRNQNGGYKMENCTIYNLKSADKTVTHDSFTGHGGNVKFYNCVIVNDNVEWWYGADKINCTKIKRVKDESASGNLFTDTIIE